MAAPRDIQFKSDTVSRENNILRFTSITNENHFSFWRCIWEKIKEDNILHDTINHLSSSYERKSFCSLRLVITDGHWYARKLRQIRKATYCTSTNFSVTDTRWGWEYHSAYPHFQAWLHKITVASDVTHHSTRCADACSMWLANQSNILIKFFSLQFDI